MTFGGKQLHCWMSCDPELANEWARCGGKNASYITNVQLLLYMILTCASEFKIPYKQHKVTKIDFCCFIVLLY